LLQEQIRDKFLGAALGLIVGDSLGAQYETLTASAIMINVGDETLAMKGSEKRGVKPGQWTDDAGQFIAAMVSYVSSRGFDGLDLAARLVKWMTKNSRGVGFHTKEALTMLDFDLEKWATNGRDIWYRSGGMKAGNGSLARCVVPGLYHWNNLDHLVEATIKTSHLTHFDPRCVESALAINFFINQCLHRRWTDDLPDTCATWLQSVRQMRIYDEWVLNFDRNELNEYTNFSPFPTYYQEHNAVVDALRAIPHARFRDLHNTGYCVNTMQAAIWAVMNGDSFEECISHAVKLGGESDTQGALAGAIAGARFGLSAIPTRWLEPLRNREKLVPEIELLLGGAVDTDEKEFKAGERSPATPPPPIV